MKKKVLVVGDVIADVYVEGTASRLSPEGPFPVVDVERTYARPGGAANVAMNAAAQGAPVGLMCCGRIGDENARSVEDSLDAAGVWVKYVDVPWRIPVKTRVVAGGRTVARYDDERVPSPEVATSAYRGVMEVFERVLPEVGVLVLSDYAKGLLTGSLSIAMIVHAERAGVPVLFAPKDNWGKTRGSTVVVVNRSEAESFAESDAGPHPLASTEPDRLARSIAIQSRAKHVVVTDGGNGCHWVRWDDANPDPLKDYSRIRSKERPVCDPTGAGDTFLGVLAAHMLDGGDVGRAIHRANAAAGIAVTKPGTAVVYAHEIEQELGNLPTGSKEVSRDEAASHASRRQAAGQRVVFANGCFDVLTPGHVSLLEAARAEGDYVVVGVNSDASVRRLKGETRPRIDQAGRVRMLSVLPYVDAVVVFDEDSVESLVKAIKPDVLVKGAEYARTDVVGYDYVTGRGGRVVLVPMTPGYSTSAVLGQK